MPSHNEQRKSKYTARQAFDIVADIEHYPDFLPWCTGARIIEKKDDMVIADLIVTFSPFSDKFRSKVLLKPPGKNQPGNIDVEFIEGPFKHLHNKWVFTPYDEGSTIDFSIDFSFRSPILEKLIGFMFDKAVKKMSAAFAKRAEEVYGEK